MKATPITGGFEDFTRRLDEVLEWVHGDWGEEVVDIKFHVTEQEGYDKMIYTRYHALVISQPVTEGIDAPEADQE